MKCKTLTGESPQQREKEMSKNLDTDKKNTIANLVLAFNNYKSLMRISYETDTSERIERIISINAQDLTDGIEAIIFAKSAQDIEELNIRENYLYW